MLCQFIPLAPKNLTLPLILHTSHAHFLHSGDKTKSFHLLHPAQSAGCPGDIQEFSASSYVAPGTSPLNIVIPAAESPSERKGKHIIGKPVGIISLLGRNFLDLSGLSFSLELICPLFLVILIFCG